MKERHFIIYIFLLLIVTMSTIVALENINKIPDINTMPNFQTDEDTIHYVTSGNPILIQDLNEATAAFEVGNKEECYKILEQLTITNGLYKGDSLIAAPPVVTLYTGIFKAREEKYEEAIELLNSVVNESNVGQKARWYLGNTYVLTNQNRKAKEQFKMLSKRNSLNYLKVLITHFISADKGNVLK